MAENNGLHEKVDQLVSDVSYIKAKIEIVGDHEERLRVLERFRHGFPSIAVLALTVGMLGLAIPLVR
jgi:hypothetical protein